MKKRSFSIFEFLKPYKKSFIAATTLIVIENILEISLPFLMNVLLKQGVVELKDGYSYDKRFVYLIGAIMIVFALVAFICGYFSAKLTAISGRGLGYELRRKEYETIMNYSFSNLDEFRTNSLITRMTSDVQIISDTFCQVLRPLLRGPFQLLFAIVFAFLISKELSVVFAIAIPALALVLCIILMVTRPRYYQLQSAIDKINRTTEESLTALKFVRANAKGDYEISKFDKVSTETKKIGLNAHMITAINQAVMNLMTGFCTIFILLIGSKSVLENWHPEASAYSTAADIASFLSYATQTLASLNMISNVFMSFTRSSASLKRVKEVFSAQSEIVDNRESKLQVENGSLSFNHVYFKYNRTAEEYVLNDIDFSINHGSTLGILGETGSSKSTLILLIERFYDVLNGSVEVGGHDVKDYSLENLRKGIAICFQSPRLFKGTVKENLLWGDIKASDEEIIEACKIAQAHDFIVNSLPLGYDTVLSEGGNNISGGQRQRLCIARALLRKPKILILDDSFSALDRITEKRVKESLNQLKDVTKVIISQKVSAISDCDKILVLEDGKVHNFADSSYLLEHDSIYSQIAQLQREGRV